MNVEILMEYYGPARTAPHGLPSYDPGVMCMGEPYAYMVKLRVGGEEMYCVEMFDLYRERAMDMQRMVRDKVRRQLMAQLQEKIFV